MNTTFQDSRDNRIATESIQDLRRLSSDSSSVSDILSPLFQHCLFIKYRHRYKDDNKNVFWRQFLQYQKHESILFF